jgi:hypothetical protein
MRKLKIVACLLSMIMAMAACSKKDSNKPAAPCSQLFSLKGGGIYYQFGYNADGKLNEIKTGNGSDALITYKLAVSGLLAEEDELDHTTGEKTVTTYQPTTTATGIDVTYQINSYKANLQVPYNTYNELHRLTITDGNLISEKIYNSQNVLLQTATYNYDLSKKQGYDYLVYYTTFGNWYISKNELINKSITLYGANPYLSDTNLDYSYDSFDRYSTLTQTSSVTQNDKTTTTALKIDFTYQCNGEGSQH